MKALLTVPHGCEGCDNLAPLFSRRISHFLDLVNISNVRMINYYPRDLIDMNRPESRDSDFRNELEVKMKELSKKDVLIDVHSFPDNEDTPFEVYFLDIEGIGLDDKFTRGLCAFLVKNDVNAAIFKGSRVNDIIIQGMKLGHKLLTLVEINESLSYDRMDSIAKLIASFISTVNKNNTPNVKRY